MRRNGIIIILLLLISAGVRAQPQMCVVHGRLYRNDGQAAAGAILRITRTTPLQSVPYLMHSRPLEDTADATGYIVIHAVRNSVITAYAAEQFGVNGFPTLPPGIELTVPDADSAELWTIAPPGAVPALHVVIVPHTFVIVGDGSGFVDTLSFPGASATWSFGTVDVTFSPTGDTSATHEADRVSHLEGDVAAHADSIARLLDSIAILRAALDALGNGNAEDIISDSLDANARQYIKLADVPVETDPLAIHTEVDPIATPAAATALDTAKAGTTHARRSDNPHGVTAGQVGAPSTLELADVNAAWRDTSRAWRTFLARAVGDTCIVIDSTTAPGLYIVSFNPNCIGSSGTSVFADTVKAPGFKTACDTCSRTVFGGGNQTFAQWDWRHKVDAGGNVYMGLNLRGGSVSQATLKLSGFNGANIISDVGNIGGMDYSEINGGVAEFKQNVLVGGATKRSALSVTGGIRGDTVITATALLDSVRLGSVMMDSIPANEWIYSDTGRWCYIGGELPHVPYPWTYGPLYKQGVVRIRFQTKCTYSSPSSFKLVLDTANGVFGGEVNWYIRSFRTSGTSLGSHRLIGNWGIGPSGAHSETSGYGGETSFARVLAFPSSACIGVVEAFMVANNGVWVDGWIEVAFQIPPANSSAWYVKIIDL